MKKRPVAYMLAIVGCLALITCTLKTSQAQNDAAQRLFQEDIFQMEAMGDFTAAIEIFEKLVSEYPGNKPLASRSLLMAGHLPRVNHKTGMIKPKNKCSAGLASAAFSYQVFSL
jgi:outer membrane protein assembly factor BamD (BamD/ComL family)